MRIALFHDLSSGGAKRAVFEVGKRLGRIHDVSVYSLSSADHEYCDLKSWVNEYRVTEFRPSLELRSPIGRLNQIQRWRDLNRLDRIARGAASQIALESNDVLYAHPSMWTQSPLILRYSQIPSVYHVHEPLRKFYEPLIDRPYHNGGIRKGLDSLDPLLRLYRRRLMALDRSSLKSAGVIFANSFFTAENIEQNYGRKAHVAYFGVDANVFRPLRNTGTESFVLSVGAVRAHKGFDFIIRALAQLPSQNRPRFRLVANAVDERERAYLHKLATQREVRFELETKVSERELIERYNQATVFVYSSVREPFGLAPLEAMACGTPVVAVSEGGVQETVTNGETGYLVSRDPVAFADKVATLMKDRHLRDELGSRARDHVLENWTWDTSVARIEQLLISTSTDQLGFTPETADRFQVGRSHISGTTA